MRVASGDLKMQHILKHLTEPTGERQHPFGTRLCLQSLVCYTLVPADAEKGLRLELLKDADPEMKAKLRLALLT